MADMTPEERARKALPLLTDIEIKFIAQAIREAENAAIERCAMQLDDYCEGRMNAVTQMAGDVQKAIRTLKHKEPSDEKI